MPYITYSGNGRRAELLFTASKKLVDKFNLENTVVERRGQKTIRKVVKNAVKLGFDTAIILKFEEKGSLRMRADTIEIKDIHGDYTWGKSITLGDAKVRP
jgi:hypothetical protein